ncbi:claudin-4-like [Carcharodon carcharias]|uniref:claudin-4-like n=1 Tax=Carcharodon carcharias TaxID=13397 RepID=UPI001B7F32A1|nr:claudin-4-like [Carcharodon carcharias]
MASKTLNLHGYFIGILGLVMACGTIRMPQWKMTSFIGNNILTPEMVWKGIWMNCIYQATGYIQCKTHESQLVLPPDIQLARALMCMPIVSGFAAIIILSVGMKCVKCAREDVVGGTFFIFAGLCVLIPVSWTAKSIILDFYNPQIPIFLKRELGNALFLGWAAACILIIGGVLLCCSCECRICNFILPVDEVSSIIRSLLGSWPARQP